VGQFFVFQPETLPGGFSWPDLQFGIFLRGFGSYILGGRIIGLVQLGGHICYWRHYGLGVFQLIYCSETSHTFLPSSDLPSHGVLQCFEAIREEVVLPLIYSSQDLRIVRERASHIAEGIHWIAVLLGLQLGEAFGSLDLRLSCILEAISAIHSMYSRSVPFCMRLAIIINKIRSEVFVLFT
jgi:hypothetical protein